jgi:hypothetical protein
MLEKVAKSKDIFDNAEPEYERYYFDEAMGGFVLVHEGHNRGESFGSELFVAEVFAKNGSQVKLLDESDAVDGKRPDAQIDGKMWDFKRLTQKTERIDRRVQEGYLTARKQGAIGVAFHVDRAEIDIPEINKGVKQAIYWDRSKQIDIIAIIHEDKLSALDINEWQNGQGFREF